MNLNNALQTYREYGWNVTINPACEFRTDTLTDTLALFALRTFLLFTLTAVWVVQVLLTGFFSVAMVVLIGVAIGNAHWLLPKGLNRSHRTSAFPMVLFGSLAANVLAGLALFSANMGIDYWQVLAAQRFPEDMPRLAGVFADSFRIQDVFYYVLAIGAVFYFARRKKSVVIR
ncbi:MAG: hypothetical protein C0616_12360 [Desulfuromonas sp.]|nr:MAG: hypothetical protein C0616_12360 [Desulfuromonas sp.]